MAQKDLINFTIMFGIVFFGFVMGFFLAFSIDVERQRRPDPLWPRAHTRTCKQTRACTHARAQRLTLAEPRSCAHACARARARAQVPDDPGHGDGAAAVPPGRFQLLRTVRRNAPPSLSRSDRSNRPTPTAP